MKGLFHGECNVPLTPGPLHHCFVHGLVPPHLVEWYDEGEPAMRQWKRQPPPRAPVVTVRDDDGSIGNILGTVWIDRDAARVTVATTAARSPNTKAYLIESSMEQPVTEWEVAMMNGAVLERARTIEDK